MVVMEKPRWCSTCQDYVVDITSHRKQHGVGSYKDQKQYTGKSIDKRQDYMICVLHQRKVPCSARKFDGTKCDYEPLGMIRKSFMMNCIKGLSINPTEHNLGSVYPPFFPVSDASGSYRLLKIDVDSKTVIIKGMTIHLKF